LILSIFPNTLKSAFYKLGISYYAHKNYEKAGCHLEKILHQTQKLDPDLSSFTAAEVLHNLACCQFQSDEQNLALQTFRKSHIIQENLNRDELYSCKDLDYCDRKINLQNLATTQSNMGKIKLQTGDSHDAIKQLESSLTTLSILLEKNDTLIVATMENLANANIDYPKRRLKMYYQILRIIGETISPYDLLCAKVWSKISHMHFEQDDHARTLECINNFLRCYKRNGKDDKEIITEFEVLLKQLLNLQKHLDTSPNKAKIAKVLRMASF